MGEADQAVVANWYARDIRIRRGMMGSLSGGLASLGAATPYAVAAKMAHPDRPVIGFIGDGAMQMNGLNVMITVSQILEANGPNPHFIIMVLNNQRPEPGDVGRAGAARRPARPSSTQVDP